jgi:hypothetical protein
MKHLHDIEQVIRFETNRVRTQAEGRVVPTYRVGEPFRRARGSWPEGAQFYHSPAGHELTLFHSDITEDMVQDVRQGHSEFALIVEPPVIVLAYRFGRSIPWGDAPYSWHLQSAKWRVVPPLNPSPESRALLWVSLVGAEDGIIRAQRGLTLSPRFTCTLQDAIRAQVVTAFDPGKCTKVISNIFLNHPSTVDRLSLAVARTNGNE